MKKWMKTTIEGDLIALAKQGQFDVIAHGCNCMCVMGAGIAPQMAEAFGCDDFADEHEWFKGDINKLGTISYAYRDLNNNKVAIVNAYTQFAPGEPGPDGIPLDYTALRMCMRKINHEFKGLHIGLPMIGCGLAGGDWKKVEKIIIQELEDCNVTIVKYNPNV